MKNLRSTGGGRKASERLTRLKVSTRTQRLSSASTERTIGKKEAATGKQGVFSRVGRSLKADVSEFVYSSRPENERTDPTNKVEAGAAFKARSVVARVVDKVPGAGTVARTVSSGSGMSENVEAVGQRYAKDGARRVGLRSAKVAGHLSKKSVFTAGRGAKNAAETTLTATRSGGVAAGRAAQYAARAAARSAQAVLSLVRTVIAVVSGVVTSGPFLAGLAAVVAVVAVVATIFSAIFPTVSNAVSCTVPAAKDSVSFAYGGYSDPDQKKNAAAIIRAGKDAGLETRDVTIGVMVAMGESRLRVIAYGDAVGPDSRGLFQQRDSWGPLSVRMDPYGSAGLFFAVLKKVPDRAAKPPTIVGHEVQRNADPNQYEKFWDSAVSVVSGGSVAGCSAGIPGDLGKDDDYPFKSGTYNAPNQVTGFALKNCTDFAWWRMMAQLGITDQSKMDARQLGPGNGATWGQAWKRSGWTVTMTPKVGAIIWYGLGNPGGDPIYGHVAVVKAIGSDGKVLEEGYNMGPDHLGAYYTRTIAANSPSGYLLIPTKEQFVKAA